MSSAILFQCIPAYKPVPTIRLIKSLPENCKILLDIEDSIQDIENPEFNSALKEKAREDLLAIIAGINRKFSLRINNLLGKEFERDKKILLLVKDKIESVFIPKVENKEEINFFCDEFDRSLNLNLIVETRKGIECIDKILNTQEGSKIEFIFFGNYDYHLDTDTYPIAEQNSSAYWEIVKPLISIIEKNKISFGNSPYANIPDVNCLHHSFSILSAFCCRNFGLMSLHKIQTNYFQMLMSKPDDKNKFRGEEGIYAKHVSEFIKNKLKGRSFAIDKNNRIITPQEYLLLKKRQNG
ncbi:MAG: hypothetical protein HY063_09695 [Bacteroidetes bacterium]|nr:hypothetical protein [Bacteroidota bacterium]